MATVELGELNKKHILERVGSVGKGTIYQLTNKRFPEPGVVTNTRSKRGRLFHPGRNHELQL